MGAPPVLIIFGAAVKAGGRPSGALRDRAMAAVALGRRFQDPVYLATGGLGEHPPAEAQVIRRLLREAGVDDRFILLEETATDTLSSVKACATVLRRLGHTGAVYAVTSGYHLPRCVLLLRLAGIAARPAPPPATRASASFRKRWWWRLRELPAIPYDAALLGVSRLRGRLAIGRRRGG